MPKSYADIFDDDISVPEERLIYFSKVEAIGTILAGGAGFYGGIFLFNNDSYILGPVLCLATLFLIYTAVKKLRNRDLQLVINSKGIGVGSRPIRAWHQISKECVVTERSGRFSNTYLVYNSPLGVEKVDIDDLDIRKSELEELLLVYRRRSEGRIKH